MQKVNKFPRQCRQDESDKSNKSRTQRQGSTNLVGAFTQCRRDTVDPLTSRYQRRGVSPRQLLAAQLQAAFDDVIDESDIVEQELDDGMDSEDPIHFIHHER